MQSGPAALGWIESNALITMHTLLFAGKRHFGGYRIRVLAHVVQLEKPLSENGNSQHQDIDARPYEAL